MKKYLAGLFLWPAIAFGNSGIMEEIVVTATRSDKAKLVNPYSVDVITRDQIERLTLDQLADAISRVPGVLLTDAGQAGQKRIRIRGEEARRIALLIDNQEFVDHREVGVPMLVDVSRIQRVEVVRSPASVLYGPRAMGGVINVITRNDAREPLELSVNTTYNSATDGHVSSAQLAGATPGGLSWQFGGSRNHQQNRDTPVGEVERTEYENKGVNAALAYAVGDHRTGVGLERFESSSEVYVEPEIRFSPPFRDFIIDAPRRDRKKIRFDYNYAPSTDVFQSLTFDAYRQQSDREFNTFPMLTLAPGLDIDTAIYSTSQLDSTGINLQTDWMISETVSLVAGLQWVSDEVDQTRLREVETNGLLTSSATQVDNAAIESIAWYAQAEIELGALSILPGLRTYQVDGEMDASNHFGTLPRFDDSHTVSSLAFVYSLSGSQTIRASYSEGYIFPSLFNLVIGAFAGSSFINPDPGLSPETSKTLEIGYRYSGSDWSVDAVVFHTRADNYIDHIRCRPVDGCGGGRDEIYRNIGEARSHGVEIGVNYTRGDFNIQSSMTWLQRRKDYDGVTTWDSGVPQLSGSIEASYAKSLLGKPAEAALIARYESNTQELVATRVGSNREDHPGYGVIDAEFSYRPLEYLSMTLVAANLGDKKYRSATENLWSAGRHIRLKLGLSL